MSYLQHNTFSPLSNDYSAEKQNDLAVDVLDSIPPLPSPITSAKMKAAEISNMLHDNSAFLQEMDETLKCSSQSVLEASVPVQAPMITTLVPVPKPRTSSKSQNLKHCSQSQNLKHFSQSQSLKHCCQSQNLKRFSQFQSLEHCPIPRTPVLVPKEVATTITEEVC
jgi:hypothetical protein